jgi:hypothetical protein
MISRHQEHLAQLFELSWIDVLVIISAVHDRRLCDEQNLLTMEDKANFLSRLQQICSGSLVKQISHE